MLVAVYAVRAAAIYLLTLGAMLADILSVPSFRRGRYWILVFIGIQVVAHINRVVLCIKCKKLEGLVTSLRVASSACDQLSVPYALQSGVQEPEILVFRPLKSRRHQKLRFQFPLSPFS